MTTLLSPATVTRLEKAAVDNGFDRDLGREGDWLAFASTQAPLRLWLSTFGDALFIAAFSQTTVARALGDYGTPVALPLAQPLRRPWSAFRIGPRLARGRRA